MKSKPEKKKRVVIYVNTPDWVVIKAAAKDRGIPAGDLLMGAYTNSLGCAGSVKPAQPDKFESHKPKSVMPYQRDFFRPQPKKKDKK